MGCPTLQPPSRRSRGEQAWRAPCSAPSSSSRDARAGTVDRPRVSELLDRGAQTKLTLVSAQAGFGKTTAIANWVHQGPGPEPRRWVSLESTDAQPDMFWTYVVTALAPLVPDLADDAFCRC